MEKELWRYYQEGYVVGQIGRPKLCPYEESSEEKERISDKWFKGWEDGRKDFEENGSSLAKSNKSQILSNRALIAGLRLIFRKWPDLKLENQDGTFLADTTVIYNLPKQLEISIESIGWECNLCDVNDGYFLRFCLDHGPIGPAALVRIEEELDENTEAYEDLELQHMADMEHQEWTEQCRED